MICVPPTLHHLQSRRPVPMLPHHPKSLLHVEGTLCMFLWWVFATGSQLNEPLTTETHRVSHLPSTCRSEIKAQSWCLDIGFLPFILFNPVRNLKKNNNVPSLSNDGRSYFEGKSPWLWALVSWSSWTRKSCIPHPDLTSRFLYYFFIFDIIT